MALSGRVALFGIATCRQKGGVTSVLKRITHMFTRRVSQHEHDCDRTARKARGTVSTVPVRTIPVQ